MPQLWIWDWSMKEVFFLQSTCRPRQNLSAIGLNCAFCIHLITGYFQWELYHTTKVSVLGKFSLIPRSDVNSILKSIVLNNTQTTKRDSILQITELNKLTVEFLNYQDRTGSVIQANKKSRSHGRVRCGASNCFLCILSSLNMPCTSAVEWAKWAGKM